MTRFPRRTTSFLPALLLALLAGCSSDGPAEVADNEQFATCVEDAGLSLDGASGWSQEQQREFFSDPSALDCAATALSADERTEALAGAFPSTDGMEQADLDQRYAPVDALVGYVEDRIGELGKAEVVGRSGALIDAIEFEPDGVDRAAREQVALTVVRETEGVPDYEQWLEDNGVQDDYTGRAQYVIAAQRERTPVYEEIETLVGELREAGA